MGDSDDGGDDEPRRGAQLQRYERCVPGSAPTRPGQTREIEADERAPF